MSLLYTLAAEGHPTQIEHENATLEELELFYQDHKPIIMVISGGGSMGLGILGILYRIQEDSTLLSDIHTYVGTSVGAILCALLSIGYTAEELVAVVQVMDFGRLFSPNPSACLISLGMDEGLFWTNWLEELFEKKGISRNITFRDLYYMNQQNLVLISLDIMSELSQYMSHESFPDMPVVTGIRAAISIPALFTPVQYNQFLLVDGALQSNFAFSKIAETCEKETDIIGFSVEATHDTIPQSSHNDESNPNSNLNPKPSLQLFSYVSKLLSCVLRRRSEALPASEKRVIHLRIPSRIPIISINHQDFLELFEIGVGWDLC